MLSKEQFIIVDSWLVYLSINYALLIMD